MNQEEKNDVFQNDENVNETSSMNNESTVLDETAIVEDNTEMLGQTRPVDIQTIKDIAVEDSGVNHMAKKETKKKTKKNQKDQLGVNWVLWVCLVIILIPCLLFGWILLSAMKDTGTPILGNRFQGDLNPAIEQSHITTITDRINGLDGVENCNVNVIVATMRINVDAKDSLDAEAISALTENIYQTVIEVLPVEQYFTLMDTQKQYDLEINVYNDLSLEDDFIMYSIIKNSPMETYILQDVSTPLNAELAQELRDYVIERDKEDQEDNTENQDITEEDEG
ncbi:MAG: hypothetical protein PUF50_07155 [Erysipelotrichaceae bacterium]|nr:hypothetical protein [Erysipelotrichaceae bacterium]